MGEKNGKVGNEELSHNKNGREKKSSRRTSIPARVEHKNRTNTSSKGCGRGARALFPKWNGRRKEKWRSYR